MDTTTHYIPYEIDPGGDIELVLKDPNTQNIVPELRLRESPFGDGLSTSDFDNPPCRSRYAVFSDLYPDPQNGGSDVRVEGSDVREEGSDGAEIRFRVSSRHLILASRVFRAMLEGPWKEGTSSSRPLRKISTKGWDVAALAIVLDGIHGRHIKIPDQITLGLLARIATIVDYYGCHEAIHTHFSIWFANMITAAMIPERLCRPSLLWLYIGWAFSDERTFIPMARHLLYLSEGVSRIDTHDLPIGGIMRKFDRHRQQYISTILKTLEDIQESLLKEQGCIYKQPSNCSALMLGGLMYEKRRLDHLDPPLAAPFDGYSIASVVMLIRNMKEPEPMHPIMRNEDNQHICHDIPHLCTIKGRMKPVIDSVVREIASLQMHILYK